MDGIKKIMGKIDFPVTIMIALIVMVLFQIGVVFLEPRPAIRIYEVGTISGEALVLDSYEYCAVLIRKGEVVYFDDYFIIDCWYLEVDYQEIPDYSVMVASFNERGK